MSSSIPRELVFLLLFVAIAGVLWRHAADRKHIRKLQLDATRAFARLSVTSRDARYALTGSTAIVERREETGGVRGAFSITADFAVTIYARNEHGERFLFKWFSKSDLTPVVKHLPSRLAFPARDDDGVAVPRGDT